MTLSISPGLRDALARWLDHLRGVEGRSPGTVEAYRADVAGWLAFLGGHFGGAAGVASIARVTVTDMRAWMAFERGRGLGARSLARRLSGVKTFVRWLSEREGFEPTAILSTRSPRFTKRLPRPLAEHAALDVLDAVGHGSHLPWICARDEAVVTLLYGCGLRISEALGLKGRDAPLPAVLVVLGKGNRERGVPVLPAAREAVDRYAAVVPYELAPDEPLFRGVKGGPLRPGPVQKAMVRARARVGPARDRHAARAAPLLRHAPARRGRRPARDPGAARPRLALDHAGLHRRRHRAAPDGLRGVPSQGLSAHAASGARRRAVRGARRREPRACPDAPGPP